MKICDRVMDKGNILRDWEPKHPVVEFQRDKTTFSLT